MKKVSRRSQAIPVVLGYINTNIRSCLDSTQSYNNTVQ